MGENSAAMRITVLLIICRKQTTNSSILNNVFVIMVIIVEILQFSMIDISGIITILSLGVHL